MSLKQSQWYHGKVEEPLGGGALLEEGMGGSRVLTLCFPMAQQPPQLLLLDLPHTDGSQ